MSKVTVPSAERNLGCVSIMTFKEMQAWLEILNHKRAALMNDEEISTPTKVFEYIHYLRCSEKTKKAVKVRP